MIKREQKGFTIVELLISIGILGIIAPLLALALFQILTFTERGRAGFEAQADTRNASAWMSQDIVMAQETDLIVPTDSEPFKVIDNPICGTDVVGFTWTDKFKDRDNEHEVTYCVRTDPPPGFGDPVPECPAASPCLVRNVSVFELDGTPVNDSSNVIARNIVSIEFSAVTDKEIEIKIKSAPENRFGVEDEKTITVLMRPTL